MILRPDVHRWHARQSSTSASTSSSDLSNSIKTFIPIFAVVFVLIATWHIVRCKRRARRSTHAAPRPVVQAPPGSRLGPIIAEILAGTLIQAVAAARTSTSSSPPVYGDAQDPPRVIVYPSQPPPLLANNLPTASEDGSRTTLGAGVTQVGESSRTVVIHQDAGGVPDDEAAPVELPPPYSSIALT